MLWWYTHYVTALLTSTCDWESQLAVVFNDNHVLSTVGDTNCGIRLGNEEVFTDI